MLRFFSARAAVSRYDSVFPLVSRKNARTDIFASWLAARTRTFCKVALVCTFLRRFAPVLRLICARFALSIAAIFLQACTPNKKGAINQKTLTLPNSARFEISARFYEKHTETMAGQATLEVPGCFTNEACHASTYFLSQDLDSKKMSLKVRPHVNNWLISWFSVSFRCPPSSPVTLCQPRDEDLGHSGGAFQIDGETAMGITQFTESEPKRAGAMDHKKNW